MMSANIPPGIPFLVKRLPQLFFPPALVFVLLNAYYFYFGGSALSTSLVSIFYILSFPATLTLSVWYTAIVNRVAAARLGAVMLPAPPFIDDPTPGGILSLYRAIKSVSGGYLGTPYDCLDYNCTSYNVLQLMDWINDLIR